MGVAAAVSRAFGAVRVLVIAAVLGTTYLGNAFQSANTVSNVLFELLAAGALSAVLVPSFVARLDAGSTSDAEHLAGEILGLATVVLGVVTVIGLLTAPWLADVLTSAVTDPDVAAAQQDLTKVLLWFFLPQVVMYGFGAVAIAVLHAQRSFIVPAVAPIGNTVAMVALLGAFAVVAGGDPGLQLTLGEQALLGMAGTLGVLAFVAIPGIAVHRSGFRLRPRFSRDHSELMPVLRQSGWASLQHGFAALLLGAAIIAGGAVEGGVVAYQVGWFFFLAPYGVIAQPIHTTILPELVVENAAGDRQAFAGSLRWAMDSMSVLLIPITALCLALAMPAMAVLAFGQADTSRGVDLLAAALASLGIGLLPYGAFFLLARAFYVLGDSKVAAIAGGVGALVGIGVMAAGTFLADGSGTVVLLGIAHSIAFFVGTGWLLVVLRRRIGEWVLPSVLLKTVPVAAIAGVVVWWLYGRWSPTGRLEQLIALVVLTSALLGVYVAAMRVLGVSVTARVRTGGSR